MISLILSWVAVLKSQAAIRSSDRQFLFDRRLSAYMLLRDLVSGYEQAKGILPNDESHGAPDFVYGFLCNVSSLEDIQGEARNWNAADSQIRFMLKIDKVRKVAVEMRLLFPTVDTNDVSIFITAYTDVLVKLRAYYILIAEQTERLKKMSDAERMLMSCDNIDELYRHVSVGEYGLNASINVLKNVATKLDEKYFFKLEKIICLERS